MANLNSGIRFSIPGHSHGKFALVRRALLWCFTVGFLLLAAFLIVVNRSHATSPAIGRPAPQLDLVRLSDDLALQPLQRFGEGQVTLLHFWGTWCGPCKMEYPQLCEAADELEQHRPFRFVPVTCEFGPGETFEGLWAKTSGYFDEVGIDSELAFADPSGTTRRSAAERLGRDSLSYPTSLLIDQQGTIAGVWEGFTPDAVDQIKSAAEQLISEIGD